MPAKPAEKPTRSSTRKRATPRRAATEQSEPAHNAIAERAYFIHLEEGSVDEVANWLRAERELTTA